MVLCKAKENRLLIGYGRGSAKDADLVLQLAALNASGCESSTSISGRISCNAFRSAGQSEPGDRNTLDNRHLVFVNEIVGHG